MNDATDGGMLSIVCPCYNEAANVETFFAEVLRCLPADIRFEFVFVDDGSTDGTLEIVRRQAAAHSFVRFVSFSRNFGKEAALLAGMRKARGQLVVTMDADLQDPPRLLPDMLAAMAEGYDCVATRRCSRVGEPPVRSLFARCFYLFMRRFSDVALVDGARDYRMMRRKIVDAIISMPESGRFTKGIYQWVGFRTKWISYENVARHDGMSKWSFWKLFLYAVDGVLAFSTAPLMLASFLSLFCCVLSVLGLACVGIRVLVSDTPPACWLLPVCLMVMMFSLLLFVVGILCVYLAKTYCETKRRPLYFVSDEN